MLAPGMALSLAASGLAAWTGAAVATDAEPAAQGEPVTIQLLHWAPGSAEYWDDMVAGFQASYPWITVEQEVVPWDQYFQKAVTYLSAQDGPDLMLAQGGRALLEWKDGLLPLTDEVADIRADVAGWYGTAEGLDAANTIYGIPLTLQGHLYYSHKGVLAAAGVDPESPPADWTALADVCQKVIASGKQCFLTGGGANGFTLVLWSLLQQTASPEQMAGLMDGSTSFEDPPLKDAIRLFAYMVEQGWLDRRLLDLDLDQAVERFAQGDAAFVLGLIGDAYNWSVYEPVLGADGFGTLVLPAISADTPFEGISVSPHAARLNAGVGQAITVTAWTDAPEASILFAKYLASPEVQAKVVTVAGSFPASTTVDPALVGSPHFATIVGFTAQAESTPGFMLRPNAAPPAMTAQMQLLLLGQATVDQAAAEIQRVIAAAQ